MVDQNQKPELEEKPGARPDPAGPQPQKPEPVKSNSTRLQETIDQAAEKAAARRKITESVKDKRKQEAALREKHLEAIEGLDPEAVLLANVDGKLARGLRKAADEIDRISAQKTEPTPPQRATSMTSPNPEPAALELGEIKAEAVQAALEAAPVVLEAGQAANDVSSSHIEYEAKEAARAIFNEVKKNANARELREIEMHNSQMDMMLQITNGMGSITEALQGICKILSDINETIYKTT